MQKLLVDHKARSQKQEEKYQHRNVKLNSVYCVDISAITCFEVKASILEIDAKNGMKLASNSMLAFCNPYLACTSTPRHAFRLTLDGVLLASSTPNRE